MMEPRGHGRAHCNRKWPIKLSSIPISIFISTFLITSSVLCQEHPGYPAYWGGTGLMEMPTARVIGDGEIRIGASHIYPYRYYYATVGFLPGLEINGRITEFLPIDLSDRPGWEGYGKSKDKAFDVKYQVFDESKYLPALAIGLQDFTGTQLFRSNYVVLSKHIDIFDFTLGYGAGRIGGRILEYTGDFPENISFRSEGPFFKGLADGIFGGLEVELHPKFSIIAEYNPIRYEEDKTKVVDKARSRINLGIRGKVFNWLTLDLSLQRGEEVGLMVSLNYPLGKPFLPWKPDPPFMGPVDRRSLERVHANDVVKRIEDLLRKQNFTNVRIRLSGREIFVEYENTKYLSEVKALGRVMRTVAAQSPEEIVLIHISPKVRNFKIATISVRPEHVFHFINGVFTGEEFLKLCELRSDIPYEGDEGYGAILAEAETEYRPPLLKRTGYGIKPTLQTYWNDPSGFFKYRISIDGAIYTSPWTGGSIYLLGRVPVMNTVSTDLTPITEKPVRSDVTKYMGDSPRVEYAVFDQVLRIGDSLYGLFTMGYMESMYAGLSAEIMYPLLDGRWTLGATSTLVRKRRPDQSFALEEPWYRTAHMNTSYIFPGLDLQIEARAGEFLAGDRGVRFDVTRHVRGASLSFWYTVTDKEDMVGGERYHDKGISLTIPANIFFQEDSKERYSYSTSPWTRDVGQIVYGWNRLVPFTLRFMPAYIRAHVEELKD